jgi:multidrug resistance efflux pump
MELLLILTYSAICVAVFKIFRIPVNKWTLPTAVLGGIFLIAGILLIMNYNHPFTKNARIYFATTPIMPNIKGRVVAQAALDIATRNIDAAKQGLAAAQAAAESARLAYESEIGGVNTTVARLQAELDDAQFDLDQTTVRAPGPGYVTQMALRPGMYAIPAPLRPVMVFVHKDDQQLAAGFEQNALQRVRAGDEAEIAFDALPGRIIKGKVKYVLDAIATGQLQATGTLQDMGADVPGGRAVAVIDIMDDISSYNLPGGSSAQVALYTEYAHHFAIIRRILLRMRSWQNFVFLEGHGGGGGGGH